MMIKIDQLPKSWDGPIASFCLDDYSLEYNTVTNTWSGSRIDWSEEEQEWIDVEKLTAEQALEVARKFGLMVARSF